MVACRTPVTASRPASSRSSSFSQLCFLVTCNPVVWCIHQSKRHISSDWGYCQDKCVCTGDAEKPRLAVKKGKKNPKPFALYRAAAAALCSVLATATLLESTIRKQDNARRLFNAPEQKVGNGKRNNARWPA